MSKKRILLISGTVIIVAILILVVGLLLRRGKTPNATDSTPANTQADSTEGTDIQADHIVQTGDPDDVFTTGAASEENNEPNGNFGNSTGNNQTGTGSSTGGQTGTGSDATTAPNTGSDDQTGIEDSTLSAPENTTYEQWRDNGTQWQQAFFNAYFADDPLKFATWFQKVKQEYEDANPGIIVTGPVDLSTLPNGEK